MSMRLALIYLLSFVSIASMAQESKLEVERDSTKKFNLLVKGDSRRTFVSNESVGIFGLRVGHLINKKTELGVGVYSSNLFGVLGASFEKGYKDLSETPVVILPAEIGFHYFSIYGEYTLIENNRLIFTANSQLGLGWVDIDFNIPNVEKASIRENKSLVEHSIKADVMTFEWLRLIGGVGYRYLLNGEIQIKETFNAPIYIIGFSIDFKKLYGKIFKGR